MLKIRGVDVDGYRILRASSPAAPNAIAAILLALRDTTGVRPHCHFEWAEGNPSGTSCGTSSSAEGDTPPVVREIIRGARAGPSRRPGIHVG